MISKKWLKDATLFGAICTLCAIAVMAIYYVNHNTKLKEIEEIEEVDVIEFVETEDTCQLSQFQGDGFCDDEVNTPECYFDIGDCCSQESDKTLCTNCTCQAPENDYTIIGNCSDDQHDKWQRIGNGICNLDLNNAGDFFDAGDCCLNETKCQEYVQGPEGWRGQPTAEMVEYDCPEHACIKSTNYCIAELLGDGICHDQNNSPYCDYDLGDCCILHKVLDFCCTCFCRDYDHPLWWAIECPTGKESCLDGIK